MGFIYGLAVVLVLFEGIIIQCEGGGCSKDAGDAGSAGAMERATSSNREQDSTINDIEEVQRLFAKHYKTIELAVREKKAPEIIPELIKILQNHIILIKPLDFNDEIHEYYEDGDLFLRLGNYQELTSFFDIFGDHVKKIEFWHNHQTDDVPYKQIVQNIIKNYRAKLEELRINTFDNKGFWNDLFDGEKEDKFFPKVKKFQFDGNHRSRKELKLNLIFPELKSLKLKGAVAKNCMADVTGLDELSLCTSSIDESELGAIFKNNENMKTIFLSVLTHRNMMNLIATNLKNLNTLTFNSIGSRVWLRESTEDVVYELPFVKNFNIIFSGMDEMYGNGEFSFQMPKLEKLTLTRTGRPPTLQIRDKKIVDFIKYFNTLEKVELSLVHPINAYLFDKFEHIKEFTEPFIRGNFDMKDHLKIALLNIHCNSKLQTLNLLNCNENGYKILKNRMNEINDDLTKAKRATWTLSYEKQFGTDQKYLMFKRK